MTRSYRTCTIAPDRNGSILNSICQYKQPRPSTYQIRKIWKPFCNTWILKIKNRTHLLGTLTGQATHWRPYWRPYQQSYRNKASPEKTIYHWIQNTFWSMKLHTVVEQLTGQVFVITDQPTPWKPTHRSYPVSLSIINTTKSGSIYQLLVGPNDTTLPQPINETTTPTPTEITETQMTQQLEDVTPRITPKFQARHTSLHFQAHASSLQEWEKVTLQSVTFAVDPIHFAYQLQECQVNQRSLVAIMDLCSQNLTACYGWILYLSNGEALAEGHGQNLGPPLSPHAATWAQLAHSTAV